MKSLKKTVRVFFYSIGFASLFPLSQIIVTFPYTIAAIFFAANSDIFSGNPDAFLSVDIEEITQSILMPVMFSAIILTFGLAWLLHVLSGRHFFERLSLNKTTPFLLIVSFILGFSLQFTVGYILSLIEKTGAITDTLSKYSEYMEVIMNNQSIVLKIIIVGILAPLLEELIYRGLVFYQLSKNIPLAYALIIQALLFGIVHMNIIQSSYAFVLGLLLGITLIWSRSIFLPAAIHIGMNLTGVILSELPYFPLSIPDIVLFAVSAVVTAGGILLIYIKSKSKASPTREHP